MKSFFYIISVLAALSFASCSRAEQAMLSASDTLSNKKVLIVYLSRTKNTEAVAKIIQARTGGDTVSLKVQDPYPENYQATVQQVARENESGYLPKLASRIDSIQQYDVVFIGFPTWGMQLPPPMKTFLTQYDLSGKTVVPFNTNAGYGLGSTIATINQLCTDCHVLEAFSVQGGIERDGILFVMQGEKEVQVKQAVDRWLENLKIQLH